jgi:SH3-like domain-containing protein
MKRFFLTWRTVLFSAALLAAGAQPAFAQDASAEATGSVPEAEATGPSGLPLPRFVSLRSGRVNSRIGPGLAYPVDWMYLKSGLPMEIIQEYDNWRRVRDADGAEGWINQALLSSRRTAMTAPWQRGKATQFPLLAEPRKEAAPVAFVEPGVIGTIKSCNGDWCEMTFAGRTGFMAQSQIWGAYPGEAVED